MSSLLIVLESDSLHFENEVFLQKMSPWTGRRKRLSGFSLSAISRNLLLLYLGK